MSYVVIVDMDQPGIHRFVGIENENNFELAEFDTVQEVEALQGEHPLGVFEWLVIGVKDDTHCGLDTIGPGRLSGNEVNAS